MNFYSEPAFWGFMTALFGGFFGLIKFYFIHEDRTNDNKSRNDASVERLKADNIQKSLEVLDEFKSRIEPIVLEQGRALKDLQETVKMISVIEKGLNAMSSDLVAKYDEFQQKLVNVTISFQKTIDRVDNFEKRLVGVGTVIRKP